MRLSWNEIRARAAAFEISLVGRFAIQGLVRSPAVVEVDVGADAIAGNML